MLFACSIAIAVGSFFPLIGSIDARNVALTDIRSGFTQRSLDDVGSHAVGFLNSGIVVLLGVAAVMLLGALVGSRILAWLSVLAGVGAVAGLAWRLNERFDQDLRDQYRDLLTGKLGLYLVGGGLLVALLACAVSKERQR